MPLPARVFHYSDPMAVGLGLAELRQSGLTTRGVLFIGREDQRRSLDNLLLEVSGLRSNIRRIDAETLGNHVPVLRVGYAAAAVYDPDRDHQKMLKLAGAELDKWEWESDLRPLYEKAKIQLERLAAEPGARDEELLADAASIRDESDRVARLNTRDAEGDAYDGIEGIEGSARNDDLEGNGKENLLRGLGGNDILRGAAGDDTYEIGRADGEDRIREGGVIETIMDAFGNLNTDLYTATFASARTAGWTAHMLEQLAHNRLIRPSVDYVGPLPSS